MIKLKEILTEKLPPLLYHATFNPLVPEIQKKGLIPHGTTFRNFEDIEWGVYLSNDYGFAGAMAEATENPNIPDEWFDQIVVLVIDSRKLNPKKIDVDPNVTLSDEQDARSYIYKGNIPPDAIIEIVDYT